MADNLKEVIQLVLETQGREGVDQLRKALASVGDVSAETVGDTDRLLDSLAGLNETAAKAARFDQLSTELAATTKELDDASRAAVQLSLQIGETEKPSRDMLRTYKDVRKEVTRLEGVQRKQAAAQERVGKELREAGLDTRQLGAAHRKLRGDIERTTKALNNQVGTVEREAAATRKHRAALQEQDEAFRRMARSGRLSADALRAYRERAEAARGATRGLGNEAGRLGGVFSRLRGLAAPLLAFFTFRTAGQGARALAEVARQAEDARRALTELYGSQEQGNRAYKELEDLSLRNGLAFDAVVEQAKKLMSFGLDPLGGSLQALIDQNAAVGGSMEDLDGKILALGQAWAKQKLQGEEILQLVERGVPVWDLLQKATGKNVQELQKLSSAGKLGRETIQSLINEIGRASSGAAERSLGSLSGLVERMSARWLQFKQRVIEAGVGEYMKQQLRELLAATGGFEGLAKRVSDSIIGVVEGLKRVGQQILPLAKSIGDATLWVGKHADAVLLLAKAYIALRLAEVARGFSLVASGARASTAATAAAATSAGTAAGVFGRLGGLIAGIPRLIRMTVVVAGAEAALYFWKQAGEEIQKATEAQLAFERVQVSARDLQREHIALGRELTALYRANADIQLKSGEQVSQLTKAQAEDYKFALEQARKFFEGQVRLARASNDAQAEATATERWRALGEAIKGVETQLQSLSATAAAAQGMRAFVDGAVAKFDELASAGKSARDAIKGAFDGLDLASTKGLQQAADILDQVAIRGTAAGAAVQAELRTALAAVADEDLPKVKAAAAEAFDSGSQAAKDFARAVDAINLTRLGVDVDAITTGFSKAGRAAVDQFRAAIGEVDRLGLTAAQRAEAIAQAFDNAFKKASTKTEIEALRKALQEALSEGSIGFDEFTQRIAQADKALAALSGTAPNLADGVKQGVAEANTALGSLGSSSTVVAKSVEQVGDATAKTGDKAESAAAQVQQVALSMGAVGEETTDALRKLSRWVGHPLWSKMQNFVMDLWRTQRNELREYNKELDAQLAKLDPLNAELEKLRQTYGRVSETELRATAEKIKRLNDDVRTKQEQALREQQAAESAANAARERARKEGSDTALAKPIEDRIVIDWKAPSKSVANSASAAEIEQAERISALVAPMVLARIERSRSISIRRHQR